MDGAEFDRRRMARCPPPWERPKNYYKKRVRKRIILAELDGLCGYCGRNWSTTIDHKMPQSKGGRHEKDNLVGCCQSCNQIKQDRTVEEFRKFILDPTQHTTKYRKNKIKKSFSNFKKFHFEYYWCIVLNMNFSSLQSYPLSPIQSGAILWACKL